MDIPPRSFLAFLLAFAATWVIAVAVRIHAFGLYEAKWSPATNLLLDSAALLIMLPIVALSFAVGTHVVGVRRDPWVVAGVGGAVMALIVTGLSRASLHVDSDTLATTMIWGTLALMPAAFAGFLCSGGREASSGMAS